MMVGLNNLGKKQVEERAEVVSQMFTSCSLLQEAAAAASRQGFPSLGYRQAMVLQRSTWKTWPISLNLI